MNSTGYYFTIVINDNGELLLLRVGCRGAEYYSHFDGLMRLRNLRSMCDLMAVTALFVNRDTKDGFYLPEKHVQKKWINCLQKHGADTVHIDIANVETTDGRRGLSRFYYWRDEGLVGFYPATDREKRRISRKDERRGVDSLSYTGLYQVKK